MNQYDYFISGVWKNEQGRITHVLLHKVDSNGYTFYQGAKTSENVVINYLKLGKVIFTINWQYSAQNLGWQLGAKVDYVTIGRQEFLRTIHNNVVRDNLDNLINMQAIHHG